VKLSVASKNMRTEAERIVKIRHQATTGEDTADLEEFICDVITVTQCDCRVYL
jgi:hypothetical protein